MTEASPYQFRLYVAGDAPNSSRALANLTAICRASIPDQYSIEVIDVFQDPERALANGVFMTPTLVKLQPAPVRKIVGTLSDTPTVLQALGLVAVAT